MAIVTLPVGSFSLARIFVRWTMKGVLGAQRIPSSTKHAKPPATPPSS